MTLAVQKELIKRLEDLSLAPSYQRLFLDINDEVFDDMEIVFGPRMNDAGKIMAKALMREYCPQATYRNSTLRIK